MLLLLEAITKICAFKSMPDLRQYVRSLNKMCMLLRSCFTTAHNLLKTNQHINIIAGPGANVIKLFLSVNYGFS